MMAFVTAERAAVDAGGAMGARSVPSHIPDMAEDAWSAREATVLGCSGDLLSILERGGRTGRKGVAPPGASEADS